MTSTPPGWYDDGNGARRWWDGVRWTEHVEPAAAEAPIAPAAVEADVSAQPAGAVPPGETAFLPPAPGPAYPPAPGPQKKSKLWIVWVAVGVVVLGLVIGGIVAVTSLLGGLAAGGGSASGSSDPDERAALAAVDLWDEAWSEVDCDKFVEATTEEFRSEIQLADCPAFEEQARFFSDSTDDYEVEVNSVTRDGDVIVVTTTETYQSSVDEQGQPIDTPESVTEQWQYYVIAVDDGWAIDDAGTQEQ